MGNKGAPDEMESYIVQHDLSAAFDRGSHSGLLFKLKSLGAYASVLAVCRVPLQPKAESCG